MLSVVIVIHRHSSSSTVIIISQRVSSSVSIDACVLYKFNPFVCICISLTPDSGLVWFDSDPLAPFRIHFCVHHTHIHISDTESYTKIHSHNHPQLATHTSIQSHALEHDKRTDCVARVVRCIQTISSVALQCIAKSILCRFACAVISYELECA